MPRLLRTLVAVFGGVCCLIALAHIAIGPTAIPGAIAVNTTMDSEDRFYATLFLGFGAALIWCSRALSRRRDVFAALLLTFFAGGLARLISWLSVGPPNDLFMFLGALELILPPAFWFWSKYLRKQGSSEP